MWSHRVVERTWPSQAAAPASAVTLERLVALVAVTYALGAAVFALPVSQFWFFAHHLAAVRAWQITGTANGTALGAGVVVGGDEAPRLLRRTEQEALYG